MCYCVCLPLQLTFQALDREKNMVIDTQLGIEITIKDANDNPPIFDQITYKVSIKESTEQGNFITVRNEDIMILSP